MLQVATEVSDCRTHLIHDRGDHTDEHIVLHGMSSARSVDRGYTEGNVLLKRLWEGCTKKYASACMGTTMFTVYLGLGVTPAKSQLYEATYTDARYVSKQL